MHSLNQTFINFRVQDFYLHVKEYKMSIHGDIGNFGKAIGK